MYQYDDPTAVAVRPGATSAGTPGWFTDGDPGGGAPATLLRAEFMNMLMAELLAILSAAGITPDKTQSNQLLQALNSAGVFITEAQFDNSTKPSTTAFVQRALGNVAYDTGVNAAATLTAAAWGQAIGLSGAGGYTVNVPQSSSGANGTVIWFQSTASSPVTLAAQGSDKFFPNQSGGVATLTVNPGENVAIVNNAAGQFGILSGTATLKFLAAFASSWTPGAGNQMLPGGLEFEFGVATPAGGSAIIPFASSFASSCYLVLAIIAGSSGQYGFVNVTGWTAGTFSVETRNQVGTLTALQIAYIAIGKN
jgi:hypothetical protein